MSEPLRQPRRYLGRVQTVSERVRTYWTDEALEVDLADNYEIRRRRVFFDEILLVTLHMTRRGLLAALLPLTLALVLAVAALTTSASGELSASRYFWAGAALLGGLALGLMIAPVWVVTVYGKRTRARMHFRLRQAKAREIYAEICRAAADAQRALADRLIREIPQPPPPLPLSESEIPPLPEEPPPA